jgi:hypothetical protein
MKTGDQILARTRALVHGAKYELNDPKSWKRNDWNWLGSHDIFSLNIIDNDHMTLCTIVTIVRFPIEASNLDHFHVLLSDGRIARIFDDYKNGFWLEAESADPKVMKASDDMEISYIHTPDFSIRRETSTRSWKNRTSWCLRRFVDEVR